MNRQQAEIFCKLLAAEIREFRQNFIASAINLMTWAGVFLITMVYIMPKAGLAHQSYANFIVPGVFVSCFIVHTFGFLAGMVADFEGPQIITFFLLLPISPLAVFIKMGLGFGINTALISLILIPLSKTLMYNAYNPYTIDFFKFVLALTTIAVFYGTWSIWMVSMIKNMKTLRNVFLRIQFPLWFFGGYMFSWKSLNALNVPLSYFALANPILHTMELMRGAMIGQEGSLPFWVCFFVIWTFILVLGTWAFKRLKKRLDFV